MILPFLRGGLFLPSEKKIPDASVIFFSGMGGRIDIARLTHSPLAAVPDGTQRLAVALCVPYRSSVSRRIKLRMPARDNGAAKW